MVNKTSVRLLAVELRKCKNREGDLRRHGPSWRDIGLELSHLGDRCSRILLEAAYVLEVEVGEPLGAPPHQLLSAESRFALEGRLLAAGFSE